MVGLNMDHITTDTKKRILAVWVIFLLFLGVIIGNRYKTDIVYFFKYDLLYKDYPVENVLAEAINPSDSLYKEISDRLAVKYVTGFGVGGRLDIFVVPDYKDINVLVAGIVNENEEIVHWAKTTPRKIDNSVCRDNGDKEFYFQTDDIAGDNKFIVGVNLNDHVFYSDKVPESNDKKVVLLVEYQDNTFKLDDIYITGACFGPVY